jgi:hypothetical protein
MSSDKTMALDTNEKREKRSVVATRATAVHESVEKSMVKQK